MRVAIVNDLRIATEALRRVVSSQSEHSIAWTAPDGETAVRLCREQPPERGPNGPLDARDERGRSDPRDHAAMSLPDLSCDCHGGGQLRSGLRGAGPWRI